jgi:hypothetical protein
MDVFLQQLIVKHSEPLNLSHPCRNQQISNVAARVEAVYQDMLFSPFSATFLPQNEKKTERVIFQI